MRAELTAGQTSDYVGYELLQDEDLPPAKVLLADKGYDADHIRDHAAAHGATPIIPGRSNRKVPVPIDSFIYALRNLIERCFNKLKNSRRIATRYDKTALSFLGFINIASIRLWIKSLST
jgi:transposase